VTLVRIETERGHRYELDGERVPGVTTLINQGLPNPRLLRWAADAAAQYAVDNWRGLAPLVASGKGESAREEIRGAPFRERDAAAARGTEVHRYAEALAQNERLDVPEELAGYVAACADFLTDWQVRPILAERPVASRRHRYAGTFDLVAALPGEVALIDYKTGASGIWPRTALQAAGYRFAEFYLDDAGAERSMGDLGITAAYAVHLRPDGYAVHPLDADRETFSRFLEVAAVARGADTLPALVREPVRRAPRIGEGPPWMAAG
jgi:hypothetical protein